MTPHHVYTPYEALVKTVIAADLEKANKRIAELEARNRVLEEQLSRFSVGTVNPERSPVTTDLPAVAWLGAVSVGGPRPLGVVGPQGPAPNPDDAPPPTLPSAGMDLSDPGDTP